MKAIFTLVLVCLTFKTFSQGIPCNPNTFWGVLNSQVVEWAITGSTITSNGVLVTAASPGNSLAFCNNLSGGSFTPTFYSHSFDKASYYNGTAWITPPAVTNCTLSDAAGAGNSLYYSAFGLNCIDRFDGNAFVQLYNSPILKFTIADMAVDDAGNVWCLMGYNTGITDSIIVVSPAGQVIHQFAFSMNTLNGYGCFLLNGVLYVAFGSGNPLYPNTLLPITFTATTATAGTPISFNSNFAIDLASCNAGIPLSVMQNNFSVNDLVIYPTLAADHINCVLNAKTNAAIRIVIINALGKTVFTKEISPLISDFIIPTSRLSPGIYFVEVNDGKENTVKKFIKN